MKLEKIHISDVKSTEFKLVESASKSAESMTDLQQKDFEQDIIDVMNKYEECLRKLS